MVQLSLCKTITFTFFLLWTIFHYVFIYQGCTIYIRWINYRPNDSTFTYNLKRNDLHNLSLWLGFFRCMSRFVWVPARCPGPWHGMHRFGRGNGNHWSPARCCRIDKCQFRPQWQRSPDYDRVKPVPNNDWPKPCLNVDHQHLKCSIRL